MIDMHTHILPGVDDGPATVEESIELLELAEVEGITHILTTPHAYSPHYDVSKEKVLNGLATLQEEVKKRGLKIQLYSGQEIRIHDKVVERIERGEALALANSRYVLLELPSSGIPAYTIAVIQGILNVNKVPIIAHPERNRAIMENPNRLERLITNGALAQVTAGSLAGHFGKAVQKRSLQLVEANLIHAYGSDVHNKKTRPFLFDEGLAYLEKHQHQERVEVLLENNARILSNEEFVILKPNVIEKRKWWQLIG